MEHSIECAGLLQVFKGVWRMQEADRGGEHCRLSYCLFVRPQVCPALVSCCGWRRLKLSWNSAHLCLS